MRLISWNVQNPGAPRLHNQIAALATRTPDIVALQEVTLRSVSQFHTQLAELGLTYAIDSFRLADGTTPFTGPRKYGELIASRWPLDPLPANFPIPWPERVLSALIDSPWGTIELHTTHLPNGANHGWIKIDTFEGIYQRLTRTGEHPRLLCGDFNAPQAERPMDEVITWGQDILATGEVVCEGTWRDSAGREDTSARWDAAERSVLTDLASFDLPDIYRQIHGYTAQEYSWYWTGQGREIGRRFDHIFATPALDARECRYLHDFRTEGLSDHAPIEAVFAVG